MRVDLSEITPDAANQMLNSHEIGRSGKIGDLHASISVRDRMDELESNKKFGATLPRSKQEARVNMEASLKAAVSRPLFTSSAVCSPRTSFRPDL